MRGLCPSAFCLLLLACAPAASKTQITEEKSTEGTRPTPDPSSFRAAFSDYGVAWVFGGQACVARAPEFQTTCPRLPAAVDVAWNGSDAWAAVPGAGVVITLDRAAQSVSAGAVVALSSTHIYRQDGSALTYTGALDGGTGGQPGAAITGGNGQDYVLLAGELRRASDGALMEKAAGPYLVATPTGAVSANFPGVLTDFGTYRLTGSFLERIDNTGRVLARVPHEGGRVGMVGNLVVTLSSTGTIRRFTSDLQAL